MNAHILRGGPTRKISVNRRIYEFEDHPYCGPTKLNKHGDPDAHQPYDFLEAVSLWAQQGRKVDADGLCEWNREPKMKWKAIGRMKIACGETPGESGF